jgi:D-beta-D-heptose 7-phosphate kinase/D-beta-D-heptose 1-phosphate adenosyltransferase
MPDPRKFIDLDNLPGTGKSLLDPPRQQIALVTGCFDIIHVGHVKLIEAASQHGVVWVGINGDSAVKWLKGEGRPHNTYMDRAILLASMEKVSGVFEIVDTRVGGAIRVVRPAFWVKGGDYTLETLDKDEVQAANEVGARIILFGRVGDYSTTNILKRL